MYFVKMLVEHLSFVYNGAAWSLKVSICSFGVLDDRSESENVSGPGPVPVNSGTDD